jgi:hypothetical protein
MWVSDYTIDEALLRIFQNEKVYDEGQSLRYDELRRRWRRTGYRQSDLDAAIDRLQGLACVRRGAAEGEEVVILLAHGARRLRSFESLFDDLRHALARLFFPRGAGAKASSKSAGGRRRGDRVAAS